VRQLDECALATVSSRRYEVTQPAAPVSAPGPTHVHSKSRAASQSLPQLVLPMSRSPSAAVASGLPSVLSAGPHLANPGLLSPHHALCLPVDSLSCLASSSSFYSSRSSSLSPPPSPVEPLTPSCGTTSAPVLHDLDYDTELQYEGSSVSQPHCAKSESTRIHIEGEKPLSGLGNEPEGDCLVLPPEYAAAFAAAEAANARMRTEDELWAARGRWADQVEYRWTRTQKMMREERELARTARAQWEAAMGRKADERAMRRAAHMEAKTIRQMKKTKRRTEPGRLSLTSPVAATSSGCLSCSRIESSSGSSPSASRSAPWSLARARSASCERVPDEVNLQDVFHSMHGSLFDEEPEEAQLRSKPALSVLLEPVHWEVGERWTTYNRILGKGKGRAQDAPPLRRRTSSNSEECSACKSTTRTVAHGHVALATSSSVLSAKTVMTRASGWLSFRSGSARSMLSSNATSAASSAFSKVPPRATLTRELRLRLTWVARENGDPFAHNSSPCSCSVRVAVNLEDTPLFVVERQHVAVWPGPSEDELPTVCASFFTASSVPVLYTHWGRIRESFVGFVAAAQRFQEAYAHTALISDPMYADYGGRSRPPSTSRSRSYSRSPRITATRRKPGFGRCLPGYRVTSADIRIFLGSEDTPALIPSLELPPLSSADYHERAISMRDLSHISRSRVFSPLPSIPRSPLRPRFAPRQPEGRYRPVANGAFLRIRALANICITENIPWEGAPLLGHGEFMIPNGPGALASGAERVRGVAMDGIGPSALRREVRPEEVRKGPASPVRIPTIGPPARMKVPRRRRPGW
jgi:hypothetical protein